MTRVYHPNVSNDGRVCLDCTRDGAWKPTTMVRDSLLELLSLFTIPSMDNPVNGDVAEVFRNDRARFDASARDYTKRYAA